MLKVTELNQDEVKYLCERVPLSNVRQYFNNFPREFNKIVSGFRVKKIPDRELISILTNNINKPFISSYLQRIVDQWLSQIDEYHKMMEDKGFSSGEALLLTIPGSFFKENFELYFKIIEQPIDDAYSELFRDALSLVKKTADSAAEEAIAASESAKNEETNRIISDLRNELEQFKNNEIELKHKLTEANDGLQQKQTEIERMCVEVQKAESVISDVKDELKHYRELEKYSDDEEIIQNDEYPYTSIGQIIFDYYDKRWISRLADISETGEITPFVADKTLPRQWANRDRLPWNDGSEKENSIGIWNWNVTPNDKNPERDYVKTHFCYNCKITQIIQLSNCESLDDVVFLLKNGISMQFACSKLLFVYEDDSFLNGLLCSSADFNRFNILKSTVYTLPQYRIKLSDAIELAGIRIYKYLSLGIPHSIFQVRDPYEAVKSLIISRVTNANLREYGLSNKEVQHCRKYLTAIPTQTIIQELTLAYNCSTETAQEYIDGFISLADTYLSSSDIDTTIISHAIQRNTELLDLCKQHLTDEWRAENGQQIAEAESKLNDVLSSVESKQNEIMQLTVEKDKLSAEMEQFQYILSQREKLASDVESKITMQIEKAKQNVADFICNMAFVSPVSSNFISNDVQSSKTIAVFNSKVECEKTGVIEDIDSFEEELSESLALVGYDDEHSIEISQAISFGVYENVPLIISDNPRIIAQCLAASLNGGRISEIFIPTQGISIEELSSTIDDNLRETTYMICLIHGVFDTYSINLFNAISNIMHKWNNVIILLSIEGVQSNLIPYGVWNHAIYIDGDSGYEKKVVSSLQSFSISDTFDLHDRTIDMKSKNYKNAKKAFKKYMTMLSNTQIGLYSRYLSLFNISSINESKLILSQLIATAQSMGDVDHLKELFHENGIANGEKIIDERF